MVRQIVNAGVLAAVLWANWMAGAGEISGESIGVIANRYPSLFLPADYVFGIWGLIYLALVSFTLYQLLPAQRSGSASARIGWLWLANGALNIAWVVLFAFGLFGLALLVMIGLLGTLIMIHVRVAGGGQPLTRGEAVFVAWPFDLYLAWISVALIANIFQYLTFLEWSGWGIHPAAWSVIGMSAATALGGTIAIRRRSWTFPLVVAWALWGIGARYPGISSILRASYVLVSACVILTGVSLWLTPGRVRRASH